MSRVVQVYMLPLIAVWAVYDYGVAEMVVIARAMFLGVVCSVIIGHLCANTKDIESVGPTTVFLMLVVCMYYKPHWQWWTVVGGGMWYFWRWRPARL